MDTKSLSNIIISSRRRADDKIARHNIDTVISIGLGEGTHCKPTKYFLSLDFHDNTPNSSRHRPNMARLTQVFDVVQFATKHHGKQFLIHCQAGKSRSPAVALICQTVWGMKEQEAIDWLRDVHPKATPNGWVLGLCDSHYSTRLYKAAAEAGIVKW